MPSPPEQQNSTDYFRHSSDNTTPPSHTKQALPHVPSRRGSQFPFTDPDAAAAASFSADLEYAMQSHANLNDLHQHRRGTVASSEPFVHERNTTGMNIIRSVSEQDTEAYRMEGHETPDGLTHEEIKIPTAESLRPTRQWLRSQPEVDSPYPYDEDTGDAVPDSRDSVVVQRPLLASQDSGVSDDSNSESNNNHNRKPGLSSVSFRPRRIATEENVRFHSTVNRKETTRTAAPSISQRTNSNKSPSPETDVCLPASPIYGLDYNAIAEAMMSSKSSSATIPSTAIDSKAGTKDWKKYTEPSPAPRFVLYSEKTGAARGESFDNISIPGVGDDGGVGRLAEILQSGPFWIDVTDPSHSEMMLFSRLFGIHPLTTEDIQTEETREKCEMFINYYFICIRTFDNNQYSMTYMQPINVYIVVFRECVLSFHQKPIDHTSNVLRRIDQLSSYGLHITPDWINYALIDDVTDTFMPLLRFIELEVDSIDDLVLILKESEQSDMLRRIGHARKKVMQLLRLLSSKAEVLRVVIKRCGERGVGREDSETSLYLGDIQDHVITMVQNLSHYEKTLARSHSNYLAQISIEITQASNRTNDVVMKMTAMASILLPLNVVTGLFGMNVHVPGQEDEHTYAWFFGILVFMVLIAASVFWWARKYKLV